MNKMHSVDIGVMTLSFDGAMVEIPAKSYRICYGINQFWVGTIEIGEVYHYSETDLEKQRFDFPFFSRYRKPGSIINRHEVKGK